MYEYNEKLTKLHKLCTSKACQLTAKVIIKSRTLHMLGVTVNYSCLSPIKIGSLKHCIDEC